MLQNLCETKVSIFLIFGAGVAGSEEWP